MEFLQGKRVLILGLGESGLACAQFAVHAGAAHICVADTRTSPPNLADLQAIDRDVLQWRSGAFTDELLQGVDMMVVSPGLSPHQPDVAALLQAAAALQTPVYGELDWFAMALSELAQTQAYQPAVLAVTGTNGKTTVVKLTEHLCSGVGKKVVAAGNVSPAMLSALLSALQGQNLPDIWVLELSSFQLYYSQGFASTAATVLNISQDHLDWHADMAEYAASKAKLLTHTQLAVLNRDELMAAQAHSVSIGLSEPVGVGDLGLVMSGDLPWLALTTTDEGAITLQTPARRSKKLFAPETHRNLLMPAAALKILGKHNITNAMAALRLALAAGVSLAHCLHRLRSYTGEAHRCEWVGMHDDVQYIDDSKGTNVGATLAALNGLGESHKNIILLAGGEGKGQDFSPLATPAAQFVKHAILFGRDAAQIADGLGNACTIHRSSDLTQAVAHAAALASTGDIVLLSPACASRDMFNDYMHRAEVFCAAFAALQLGELRHGD